MHDPMTVAFEIRRPWPRRESLPVTPGPRWRFRGCFWHIAGRRYYWPSLITIWHVEPGGHDSGDVCKHYRHTQGPDGKWTTTYLRGWRWHVHHWRIQVRPLQNLRRWALTRCTWCHGRSHRGDYVNVSHQLDGPSGRWWQGEPGLYHHDCSTVATAHAQCLCERTRPRCSRRSAPGAGRPPRSWRSTAPSGRPCARPSGRRSRPVADMPCVNFCGRTVPAVTIARLSGDYARAGVCDTCQQEAPPTPTDPEVERQAKILSDAWDDYLHAERISEVPEAWVDGRVYKDGPMRRAAAVLADLRERYILVPREGAEVTRMHQISDPDGGPWSTVALDAHLDPRVPFRHRYWTVVVGPLEDKP